MTWAGHGGEGQRIPIVDLDGWRRSQLPFPKLEAAWRRGKAAVTCFRKTALTSSRVVLELTASPLVHANCFPCDEESNQCFMGGLVIRSLSNIVSNWQSSETLPEYLEKKNVMGIADIDTRAITRRLREVGSLIGVLTTDKS